jgi:hypothetical protein
VLKKVVFFAAFVLFFASFQSATALTGVERADLTNVRLVNSFGESLSQNINTNQQIQVSADITNKQTNAQQFVYIVEILNEHQITLKITWFSGTLNPQQTFSPAISWLPNTPGTYTAKVYLWDSISNADALSRPLEIKFIVS